MYKELISFDNDWKKLNQTDHRNNNDELVLLIPGNITEKLIGPVKRSTMYEIKMLAINKFGESLPTNEIRIVTHFNAENDNKKSTNEDENANTNADKGNNTNDTSMVVNEAPNLRKCCANRGVKNEACLKQLCEPFIIEPVDVEESIMCMKYMNTSYRCIDDIRDNIDYG